MSSIRDLHNDWRDSLVPASFRGAMFHVETSSRSSGRRTVVHQYPKRNLPYTEDMGREAIKWQISGYCIHGDRAIGSVVAQVRALIAACEADEGGLLIHPMLDPMMVMCTSYSYSDKRTAGGFFEFDMQFTEVGVPAMSMVLTDVVGVLLSAAGNAEATAATTIVRETKSLQGL